MNICTVSTFLVALIAVVISNPLDAEVIFNPFDVKTFMMPESCKTENLEYCFDNTGYPTKIVADLLKRTNLEMAKDNDVVPLEYSGGRRELDEPDCRAQATTELINYIVDEFGNDRVVIQIKDKFEQRYSITRCDKEGRMNSSTQHFLKSTVLNFKMYCENKYMHYDFLVLSLMPDSLGEWNMESARTKTGIPVCCACQYEKNV